MTEKKKIKKKEAKKKTLTSMQKKFCDILILMDISGKANQSEALRLAGSKSTGKNLIEAASRTAILPQCLAYLSRERARVKRVVEKTEAEIIAQLEKLGFSQITDFATWGKDGLELKPSKEIPKDKIPALKTITINEQEYTNKKGQNGLTRKIKIELHGPKGALDSLAKIKGMMIQVVTGEGGGPIPLKVVDFDKVDFDRLEDDETP